MKVEVGQVRRNGSELLKVITNPDAICNVKVRFENGNLGEFANKYIADSMELVTMENIKPGEWVECVGDFGLGYKKLIRYKVVDFGDEPSIKNGCEYLPTRVASPYFKPCLPPTKKGPRTYSNADIMQMMEDGKFIHGDKIINKDGFIFSFNVDKNAGLEWFSDEMKATSFMKGDRWTIEWADRWKECTVQDVLKHIYDKGVDNPWDGVKIKSNTGCEHTLENWFESYSKDGHGALLLLSTLLLEGQMSKFYKAVTR